MRPIDADKLKASFDQLARFYRNTGRTDVAQLTEELAEVIAQTPTCDFLPILAPAIAQAVAALRMIADAAANPAAAVDEAPAVDKQPADVVPAVVVNKGAAADVTN